MSPAMVDYSKYSILNYSFFQCDSSGNVFGTDEWADSVLLRGRYDWGSPVQPAYFPNTSLIDMAHVWGVRVMVSIGGWTLSEYFPSVAADPVKRAHFAQECVRVLREYKFDGIDIDWEYPGYADHRGTPADKENYTLFMKAIRDSIDAYGKKIEYKFLLTGAYGANDSQMKFIEWDKVVPIMDYINMMTYDYAGTWSGEANHNSGLYNSAKGAPGSVHEAFTLLTKKYGVPPEKLNVGVAFYGRSLMFEEGKAALYGSPHLAKVNDRIFPEDEGGPMYYNLLLKLNKYPFTEFWDDTAQVPYLIGGKNNNTFVSFDNARSVRLKAEYALKNECAGVIIWEITGDYIERSPGSGVVKETPLIDQIKQVFAHSPRRRIKKRYE